jgi:hypothetical protein
VSLLLVKKVLNEWRDIVDAYHGMHDGRRQQRKRHAPKKTP